MNVVWFLLVASAVASALWNGSIEAVSGAMLSATKAAIDLAIALAGTMALWLGLLRVVQDAGFMSVLARAVSPLLRRLFRDIPEDDPALGAITLNLAATMLGMSNAATPFGLKAMHELSRLSADKVKATDSMILFLAINTAGIQLLPLSTIALRQAAGSQAPGAILLPTLAVTVASTVAVVAVTLLLTRVPYFAQQAPAVSATPPAQAAGPASAGESTGAASAPLRPTRWERGLALAAAVAVAAGFVAYAVRQGTGGALIKSSGTWLLPIMSVLMLAYGYGRGVKVYESAVAGAKEGLEVALRITPYLILILFAVGVFKASGLMAYVVSALSPLAAAVGIPADVLPLALIRPLSGMASLGILTDLYKSAGPDSPSGLVASIIYSASDTTFYVLAVYFGAVGVKRIRHALVACLLGDVISIVFGALAARWFF